MRLARRFGFLFVPALVAAALALAPNAQAGVTVPFDVNFIQQGNNHEPGGSYEVEGNVCASGTVVTVSGVPDAVIEVTDPNHFTVTLPSGTPGGNYFINVECTTNIDNLPGEGTGSLAFASIQVDKVVVGEAPPGAEFVIDVVCELGGLSSGEFESAEGEGFFPEPLVDDVTFPAAGGTEFLVAYTTQDCVITETDTAGAASVTVETEDCERGTKVPGSAEATSGTFSILGPTDCIQTVTNTFEADVEPDEDIPDVVPDVVAATPPFTG